MFFTIASKPAESLTRRRLRKVVKLMILQGRGDERVIVHYISKFHNDFTSEDVGSVSEYAARLEAKGL